MIKISSEPQRNKNFTSVLSEAAPRLPTTCPLSSSSLSPFSRQQEKKPQNRALCLLGGGSGLQPWPCAARHRLTAAPLAFVIRSLWPKDTARHLTRLNACKMSNQGPARSFSLLPEPLNRPHISASSPGFQVCDGARCTSNSLNIPRQRKRRDTEPWKPIPVESLTSLRKIRQEAPQICGLVVFLKCHKNPL